MRVAWVTDIHLNFVDAPTRRRFLDSLAQDSDAVAISGDIGESPDVEGYLREMEEVLQRPIYFVLGNHDFYRGSIATTREAVARLAAESEFLVYLSATGVVELTPQTALIGHDGWADARLGDFANSDVILNDYALISELRMWKGDFVLDKERLGNVLNAFGDQAAGHLEARLAEAVSRYTNIIAITHVPPFREATWHEGRISDDNWLPHFSCKAAGDAMVNVMASNPQANLLVVCGHTHGGGETKPLENLRVLTGPATYGAPEIQRVIEVE
ncbi:MAG: metallophosphoesterase [Pirellulaceae bacterium]